MPSFITGEPAAVQSVLPTAKAIVSTTLATPIVVTTAAPHGLAPGDYFAVYNATDLAANGLWMAGTCTSTTVVLLVVSTGANSVGVTGGGAVGTLAPAGYGETFSIPSDLTDARDAASVNVAFESLADRTAWLLFSTNYYTTIKAGGTLFIKALAAVTAEATSVFDGVFDFATTSLVRMQGRRARGPRVAIADGNVTIDVTQGARRTIVATPSAACTITLDSTTNVPVANEVIDVLWYVSGQPSSTVLTFQRDDATPIASMTPSDVVDDMLFHAQFEYASGAWHLGPCTLHANDGTADYGVKALAGA